jgi:hypothetical protein
LRRKTATVRTSRKTRVLVYFAPVASESSDLCHLLRQRAALATRNHNRAGFEYETYEAFVLSYARGYDSARLDTRERAHVRQILREHRTWWHRGFRYKECFSNCQELMSFDRTGKLVYVEGYVWAHGDRLPPVHHGWLSLHGKVIDLTVVTRAIAHPRKLPPEPPQLHGEFEGRDYFGVPFLRSHFRERRRLNLVHGSLLDDEDCGYPLLRYGGEEAVRGRKRA